MKSMFDVSGKRINAGDRFTRNAVLVILVLTYCTQFIVPYFGLPANSGLDETTHRGLENIVLLVIGYLTGRNNAPAQEQKSPSE